MAQAAIVSTSEIASISPRSSEAGTLSAYSDGLTLPLFIKAGEANLREDTDAALAWIERNRDTLDRLMVAVGAVVLRGFAFKNSGEFNRVLGVFPGTSFGYEGGGTPRSAITGKVFESTRAPADLLLTLHQEMAYLPNHPYAIAFFCEQAALIGGETIIGDFRRFDKLVPRAFRQAVKERGVRYTYNFRSPESSTGLPAMDLFHRPWTEAFNTTDPKQVEVECQRLGLDFTWLPDGSVSTIYNSPGIIRHPETGEELWFNSIAPLAFTPAKLGQDIYSATKAAYETNGLQYPIHLSHCDGGELDAEGVDALYPLITEVTTGFPWEEGDIMMLDNILVAHGRNPYTGPRNVQVGFLR